MKKLKITVNGVAYDVMVEDIQETALRAVEPPVAMPRPVPVRAAARAPSKASGPVAGGTGDITSPMPGVILGVKVKAGDQVKIGDVLVVLEAMKMENEISAKKAGAIKEVKIKEGQTVGAGEILLIIE